MHPYFHETSPVHRPTIDNHVKIKIAYCIFVFPLLINGYSNSLLKDSNELFWVLEFSVWIGLPSTLIFWLIRSANLNLEMIGLSSSIKTRPQLFLMILLAGIIPFFYWGVILFNKNILLKILPHEFTDSFFSYSSRIPDSGVWRYLIAFYFSLSAGIYEEVFFRALPILFIKRRFSYVCISTLIFASVHWEQNLKGMFSVSVFGFVTSLYYWRFRWLLPLIIAHFITDFGFFLFS